jgi:hypothetical protein
MNDPRNTPWSPEDVEKLNILNDQGLRKRDMVFYLLRTENAIRAKLWRISRDEKRKRELLEIGGTDHDESAN